MNKNPSNNNNKTLNSKSRNKAPSKSRKSRLFSRPSIFNREKPTLSLSLCSIPKF